jgi:hypothetical protein
MRRSDLIKLIKEEIATLINEESVAKEENTLAGKIREYMSKPKIALAFRFMYLHEYSKSKGSRDIDIKIDVGLAQMALQAEFKSKAVKKLTGRPLQFYNASRDGIFKLYPPKNFKSDREFVKVAKRALDMIEKTKFS